MPKKSAIKHTPTPWWRHESPNDYEATLIEGNHRVIAAIRSENESKPTQEERANADFIIRACNNYDELVHALECAFPGLKLLAKEDPDNFGADLDCVQRALLKAHKGE